MTTKSAQTRVKRWEKANAAFKKAFEKYQAACAAYRWDAPDAGAKWKKLLALGKRLEAVWKKAEAAKKAIAE